MKKFLLIIIAIGFVFISCSKKTTITANGTEFADSIVVENIDDEDAVVEEWIDDSDQESIENNDVEDDANRLFNQAMTIADIKREFRNEIAATEKYIGKRFIIDIPVDEVQNARELDDLERFLPTDNNYDYYTMSYTNEYTIYNFTNDKNILELDYTQSRIHIVIDAIIRRHQSNGVLYLTDSKVLAYRYN